MASKASAEKSKTFRATLVPLRNALGWVVIDIPFSVATVWGNRGMLKVKGGVNGYTFRTSLFPRKSGQHFLLVNKAMQRAAGIRLGSTAQFTLAPDLVKRVIAVPPELDGILRKEKDLRKYFNALNDSARKDIAMHISEPKSAEVRERRAEQLVERLMAAMEAEQELPPLIRNAFAQVPHAHQGWLMMTPSQRRSQLLAIFYYKTPEARARRMGKTIEAALQAWERRRT